MSTAATMVGPTGTSLAATKATHCQEAEHCRQPPLLQMHAARASPHSARAELMNMRCAAQRMQPAHPYTYTYNTERGNLMEAVSVAPCLPRCHSLRQWQQRLDDTTPCMHMHHSTHRPTHTVPSDWLAAHTHASCSPGCTCSCCSSQRCCLEKRQANLCAGTAQQHWPCL